jgi:hypothetical protein
MQKFGVQLKSASSGSRAAICFSACLFSFLLTVACEGKKEEKKAADLSKFSGLYSEYLKGCGECHAPGNVAYADDVKNLDMSSESAAYTSLMSVAVIAKKAGAECAALKYVAAGSPQTSILYAIMDADTAESFTAACRPLKHAKEYGGEANSPTAEQKEKIKEWITKGAPQG